MSQVLPLVQSDRTDDELSTESSPQAALPIRHPEPSDEHLLSGLRKSDAAALRELIRRYDRLVRYTVFRASRTECARDPAWLDGLASSTWAGFVEVSRRGAESQPRHVRTLLVTIARNQTVSALRAAGRRRPETSVAPDEAEIAAALELDPLEVLGGLEDLEHLRACVAELEPDDRLLITRLELIMNRRWREAAAALDRSESTLRSQWKRLLDRLSHSFLRRTGHPLAPPSRDGDS